MARAGRLGALLLALAAGGCGDSASVAGPAVTDRGPATAARAGPAVASDYAGLGAMRSVFARAHQESGHGRQRGVPLVSGVAVDRSGRVTAYDIRFDDRPPLSNYERLVSAASLGDLPRDRITVARAASCLVYGSPSLKRLIGVSYTRVTTLAHTATARVQSTATPAC